MTEDTTEIGQKGEEDARKVDCWGLRQAIAGDATTMNEHEGDEYHTKLAADEELEALEWHLDCMPDSMRQLEEEIDSEDDSIGHL